MYSLQHISSPTSSKSCSLNSVESFLLSSFQAQASAIGKKSLDKNSVESTH